MKNSPKKPTLILEDKMDQLGQAARAELRKRGMTDSEIDAAIKKIRRKTK